MTGETASRPLLHGVATFAGFLLFGAVPLLPYVLGFGGGSQFLVAIFSTLIALLFVGLTRSFVTRETLARGVLEVLLIGSGTALVAYYTGVILKGLAGIV